MPKSEKALLLFKPDIYAKELGAVVLGGIKTLDLNTVEQFKVKFPPEGVFFLWPRIYGRRWTASLTKALPARALDVFVFEGIDAIERVIAYKDEIRSANSPVNSYRNLLHSCDSEADFLREYAYFRSIATT